jgi:Leucine-rich repeat (LRR) protein
LLYSILFYEQTAGINFLIFTVFLVGLLLYRDNQLAKSSVWLSVAAGALISSFFIFVYGSALSIWANLFSLLILSALSINPGTSFITSLLLSAFSVGTSCVCMFIDWVQRKSKQVTETYSRPFYVKLFLIIVPFLIAVLFFFFYQTSNPLFYDFTKDINLDFISIGWILFTLAGLLLMYGFFHNRVIPGISDKDEKASMDLNPELASRTNFLNGLMRTDTESLSGIILFSMLNSLLLLVNVLDFNYFLFDGKLPKGIEHKAFVHDGIGTLISSLIVAIIIILFYFRGELNYYKKAKWLKIMAFIWIAQNVFMIFSTAYRNGLYIDESGISYKKIGVYVYLALTLIGLTTTFIKVFRLKTNWYLFRVNAAACYYFLVLGCVFNWDVIITDFNIDKYNGEKKKLEKYLLLDLSFKNLPDLLTLPDSAANTDNKDARDYYNFLRGTNYYDFKSGLSSKLYEFMEGYDKLKWQSFCWEKKRVYQDLVMIKEDVRALEFRNFYKNGLKPLSLFSELRVLKIKTGHLQDLSELKQFPLLERLDLNNTDIDSLDKLPALVKLKEMDLGNNSFSDLGPLRRLVNLELLDISGNNNTIKNYTPLLALKKLKLLHIGTITPEGLKILQQSLPNTKIYATVESN